MNRASRPPPQRRPRPQRATGERTRDPPPSGRPSTGLRPRRRPSASAADRADEGDDDEPEDPDVMSAYREFTGKSVEEALRLAREAFTAGLADPHFESPT